MPPKKKEPAVSGLPIPDAFENIPDEILMVIFQWCLSPTFIPSPQWAGVSDPRDLAKRTYLTLARVCKRWKAALYADGWLWGLGRPVVLSAADVGSATKPFKRRMKALSQHPMTSPPAAFILKETMPRIQQNTGEFTCNTVFEAFAENAPNCVRLQVEGFIINYDALHHLLSHLPHLQELNLVNARIRSHAGMTRHMLLLHKKEVRARKKAAKEAAAANGASGPKRKKQKTAKEVEPTPEELLDRAFPLLQASEADSPVSALRKLVVGRALFHSWFFKALASIVPQLTHLRLANPPDGFHNYADGQQRERWTNVFNALAPTLGALRSLSIPGSLYGRDVYVNPNDRPNEELPVLQLPYLTSLTAIDLDNWPLAQCVEQLCALPHLRRLAGGDMLAGSVQQIVPQLRALTWGCRPYNRPPIGRSHYWDQPIVQLPLIDASCLTPSLLTRIHLDEVTDLNTAVRALQPLTTLRALKIKSAPYEAPYHLGASPSAGLKQAAVEAIPSAWPVLNSLELEDAAQKPSPMVLVDGVLQAVQAPLPLDFGALVACQHLRRLALRHFGDWQLTPGGIEPVIIQPAGQLRVVVLDRCPGLDDPEWNGRVQAMASWLRFSE